MRKVIHKLRQRPEEEKRHILHILITVCAIIMIVLWSWSLGRSITNTDTQTKVKEDLQPFSVLKDNLVGGYKDISGQNSN